MAVLGLQLVTTLIAATFFSKLLSVYSFTRLIYKNLTRCCIPSDAQLLEASGNCKVKNKTKKKRNEFQKNGLNNNGVKSQDDVFYIPRNTAIQLSSTNVVYSDMMMLPLFSNLQWLVDFTVCAGSVYIINEVAHNFFFPWCDLRVENQSKVSNKTLGSQINLSIVWILLCLWFTFSTLFKLTALYFQFSNDSSKSEQRLSNKESKSTLSGELILVLASGFFFLVSSIICLTLDGRMVDFGLVAAHSNFIIDGNISESKPMISWGAFNAILAITASIISSMLVFPGIKYGTLYFESLRSSNFSFIKRLLLHICFIAPILPLLLWIVPMTQHITHLLLKSTHSDFVIRNSSLSIIINFLLHSITNYLDLLRFGACIFVIIIRLLSFRWLLQTYLNSAQIKLDRFRHEPGQISNKEIQRLVSNLFYCFNLVVLQCIAPLILLICFVFLFKNSSLDTGSNTFPVTPGSEPQNPQHPVNLSSTENVQHASWTNHLSGLNPDTDLDADSWFFSVSSWPYLFYQNRQMVAQLVKHFRSRMIVVSHSVFGFLLWWTLLTWQFISLVGLAYRRFTSDDEY